MLPIQEREKAKILWLARWPTPEIAEVLQEPVDEIQALVNIFQGRPQCHCTESKSKPSS